MELQDGKTVALLGYGISHKGLLSFLKEHTNWVIDLYDEKEILDEIDGVREIYKGLELQSEYDIVYKTPGIPVHKVSVPEETILSNDTDLFLQLTESTVIGVTGTKGKSTTASLIYHILKESGKSVLLAGNIGASIFDIEGWRDTEYVVYEMSSFQCDQLTTSPHIAVLTNIYHAHTIEHDGHDNYVAAKKKITKFQNNSDFFVTTLCDIPTQAQIICVDPETARSVTTKMIGEHNQINIELAMQACELVGVTNDIAIEHVATYEPLPGRIEKVAEKDGIEFYDDALGTVPEATIFTIRALPVTTLITGGSELGFDYKNMTAEIQKSGITKVIYFKDTGGKIIRGLKGIECVEAHSMKQAIDEAFSNGPGICMLSSASPSFSMFENYKDRSRQYLDAINTR